MNWVDIFHLYVFRFIQRLFSIKINKNLLIIPFNTLITTKKDSMFVTYNEEIDTNNMKNITCTTYLGKKKDLEEKTLTNNTTYVITSHTVKFLEISLNIQSDYIVNHYPDYVYTDTGIVVYSVYINEQKFEFEILSEFHIEDGWAYLRDVIRPRSSNTFAVGSGMYEGISTQRSRNNLKWNILYTVKEELQGVSLRIERPEYNSSGHSISWTTDIQKLLSVKYWDIDEGQIIETSFDSVYFDNL